VLTYIILQFALPVVPSAPGGPGGSGGNDAQMEQMQELMAKMQAGQGMSSMGGAGQGDTGLSAEAKKWVTVYPIYFDSKRKYMKGCRRVAYENSCLWPKSEEIQAAVAKLTLMHAHEVSTGLLLRSICVNFHLTPTVFALISIRKHILKIGRIQAESKSNFSMLKESQRIRISRAVRIGA
jgi:hypothetical protein